MTILKREQTANLYNMTGSIIIGNALISREEDTTRLCHMRLVHMSERDLQALYNKRVLPGISYFKLGLCKFCIRVDSVE